MRDGSPLPRHYRAEGDFKVYGVVTAIEDWHMTVRVADQTGLRRDGAVEEVPGGLIVAHVSRALKENNNVPVIGDKVALLVSVPPVHGRSATIIWRAP